MQRVVARQRCSPYGYFTNMKVLFAIFLVFPRIMVVFLSFFDFIEFGTILQDRSLGRHHRRLIPLFGRP